MTAEEADGEAEAELERRQAKIMRLQQRIAELAAALRDVLPGIDDYWRTTEEGKAACDAARAVLAQLD